MSDTHIISFSRTGWIFIIWSLVGSVIMALGINQAYVGVAPLPDLVKSILNGILGISDSLWLTLAAFLVFRHEARHVGTGSALFTFAAIALPSALAEWLGATTGILFGHYDYTDQFGSRIAGVLPFTVPLAWYAVVVGSARLVDMITFLPRYFRPVAVGVIATLTDFNLEPVAMHIRGYWQWTDGPQGTILASPPFSNYLTWFVLSALLSLFVKRPKTSELIIPSAPKCGGLHPVLILALMNLLFLLAHLGNINRG